MDFESTRFSSPLDPSSINKTEITAEKRAELKAKLKDLKQEKNIYKATLMVRKWRPEPETITTTFRGESRVFTHEQLKDNIKSTKEEIKLLKGVLGKESILDKLQKILSVALGRLSSSQKIEIAVEAPKKESRTIEDVTATLDRLNSIRDSQLGSINKMRIAQERKGTGGDIEHQELLENLHNIKKEIVEDFSRDLDLKPGESKKIRGNSLENELLRKYNYTVSKDSKGKLEVYVHIPKSSFTRGGQKEIKLAVDLSGNLLVRGVHNISQSGEIKGEKLVMQRCRGSKFLNCAHAITNFTSKSIATQEDLERVGILSPFIEGETLSDSPPTDRSELLTVYSRALSGYRELHDHDLIYQDAKAENIMRNGKIIDFGTVIDCKNVTFTPDEVKILKVYYKTCFKPIDRSAKKIEELNEKIGELERDPTQRKELAEAKKLLAAMEKGPGLARKIESFVHSGKTPTHMPPRSEKKPPLSDWEIENFVECGRRNDVYQAAVTYVELFTPLNQERYNEIMADLMKEPLHPKESQEDRGKRLHLQTKSKLLGESLVEFKTKEHTNPLDQKIQQALNEDPEKRPTMKELYKSVEAERSAKLHS